LNSSISRSFSSTPKEADPGKVSDINQYKTIDQVEATGKPEKKKNKLINNKKLPKIDLKVIYYEDTSKYEGEPLIKPKTPYQYDVKTYQFDPKNKTMTSRLRARTVFTADRTRAYLRDIRTGRTDAVLFKTVEFMKRNVLLVRGLLYSVWLGLKHMVKGLRKVKRDVFFLIGFQRKMVGTKYA
jgi:hypothetical protein